MSEQISGVALTESDRRCPRCGRPVDRGPKARWCSSSCKARFYLERRLATVSRNVGSNQCDVGPERVEQQEGMCDVNTLPYFADHRDWDFPLLRRFWRRSERWKRFWLRPEYPIVPIAKRPGAVPSRRSALWRQYWNSTRRR